MKKMLLENIKPILVGILALLGVLVGSLSGGYVASVPAPAVLGALSGPDISSPYLAVNGVQQWYASMGVSQASTTICSVLSPASTSTLQIASVQITTGSSTPLVYEIAKSTLQSATTTRLAYASTTPGYPTFTAQTAVATSTSPEGTITSTVSVSRTTSFSDMVFAPNTYLNWKVGGAKGDLNVLVGSCKAKWIAN